jgi:hypothetical protein
VLPDCMYILCPGRKTAYSGPALMTRDLRSNENPEDIVAEERPVSAWHAFIRSRSAEDSPANANSPDSFQDAMDEDDDAVDHAELENMDDIGLGLNSPAGQTPSARSNGSPGSDASTPGNSDEDSEGSDALGSFGDIQDVIEHLVKEVKAIRKEVKIIRKENRALKTELTSSVQAQAATQATIGLNSITQLASKTLWDSVGLVIKRQNGMDKRTRADMKTEMLQLSVSTRASVQLELQDLEAKISATDVSKRVSQLGKAFQATSGNIQSVFAGLESRLGALEMSADPFAGPNLGPVPRASQSELDELKAVVDSVLQNPRHTTPTVPQDVLDRITELEVAALDQEPVDVASAPYSFEDYTFTSAEDLCSQLGKSLDGVTVVSSLTHSASPAG